MSDSPNPSQDVERYWPNMLLVRTIGDDLSCSVHWVGAGSALQRLERHEVAEYMPVAQHEELIQAEVEKREGLRGDLQQAEKYGRELAADLEAESKLSSAVGGIHRRISLAEDLKEEASAENDLTAVGIYLTVIATYRTALQLLRDKGTEQGGGCEHGNTFDCPDCRLDVLELLDDDEGVSTEGDPGLLNQALAALDEIASRATEERNPDGEDQAAETMALLAREHAKRIRSQQSTTGKEECERCGGSKQIVGPQGLTGLTEWPCPDCGTGKKRGEQ